MKGVILCGGLATRFLPISKSIPKEMLPILDRPAIDYIVRDFKANGITDILIILGRNKECLENYFKLTTDISSNIYKDWINEDIFNAHKEYAKEIIRMYHGKEFIEQAVSKYETKASKSITDDIDTITISNNLPITLIDLLLELNLVASKSEARRLIEQNGISINQIKENDVNRIIDASDFKDGFIVIQKGKKVFLKVELEA